MTGAFDTAWSETDLRDAFAAERFELHYQPQYGARDGRLCGVEGLARLRHRSGALLAPDRFIPVIERTDLIHDFGAALFRRACLDALRWPDLTVAVNVSPVQFQDPGLADRLIAIADRAGIDRARVEIEITEGVFFDQPRLALTSLGRLREAGFSVALDDFGTGYSSLAYLLRYPVTKIKIDRSFIEGLPGSMRAATIIQALVAMTRALGLKVVAEGVETEGQRAFLRTAGCHILQGFLFAAALPAADIGALRESAPLRAQA